MRRELGASASILSATGGEDDLRVVMKDMMQKLRLKSKTQHAFWLRVTAQNAGAR